MYTYSVDIAFALVYDQWNACWVKELYEWKSKTSTIKCYKISFVQCKMCVNSCVVLYELTPFWFQTDDILKLPCDNESTFTTGLNVIVKCFSKFGKLIFIHYTLMY